MKIKSILKFINEIFVRRKLPAIRYTQCLIHNYYFLVIASSLGINWARRIPGGPQIVIAQVSQRIHPELHSERM